MRLAILVRFHGNRVLRQVASGNTSIHIKFNNTNKTGQINGNSKTFWTGLRMMSQVDQSKGVWMWTNALHIQRWVSICHSEISVNPKPLTYVLQSLHLQIGIHFLISSLNLSSTLISLYTLGSIVSHTIGPKYLNDNFPIYSVFTFGITNAVLPFGLSLNWNRSLIISGQRPFLTLNITMATNCMFQWLIVTDPSFLSKSSNEEE